MECNALAHTFLNSTLDGVEWPVSHPDQFTYKARAPIHWNQEEKCFTVINYH